jgi:uncharacterized protein
MHSIRFSHRPNRAHEIAWRGWSAEAFAAAEREDRPILLHLTAVWCRSCQEMDETTFSDPDVISLLNDHFVALRVDTDRSPHVQDRYMTAGWPTTAFLTPTGEVLWAGGAVASEEMIAVGTGVLAAWRERRGEFEAEIERRRRAMAAARNRPSSHGLVRREAADDVLTAILEAADARHGGFGDAPKFPAPQAIELLYRHGSHDPARLLVADQALDGMIAGELLDRDRGGFFRYALAADWTAPPPEKLLAVNADLLRVYALGARARGRADWADVARGVVAWVDAALATGDGLWGGSVLAGGADGSAETRIDGTVYTGWNATWIGALADAAADLGEDAWSAAAATALRTLLDRMAADDGLLHHFQAPGAEPCLPILALDVLLAARACIAVAQATGDAAWLAEAKRLAHTLDHRFWAEEGGLHDRLRSDDDVGALRYRDRPFELNALAARFLIDLALATGERKYRAFAERVLAALSPQAGRFGVGAADFAIAAEDFFQAPLRVFIVGDAAASAPLRAAACALPLPDRRVWPVTNGARLGPLVFRTDAHAAAFVCGERGASLGITEPDRLEDAVAAVS